MTKQWLWAGIDLGVETASVCIINNSGDVLHAGLCPSSTKDVRHELCKFRRTRFASVGFESGMGSHVARGLKSLGYPVQLYEARQLSKFLRARRNKTDAGDARGIAEAGRISAAIVSKVYLKSLGCQALQSRLAIRRHLIQQRVAVVSMLCRQIELFGGRLNCNPLADAFQPAAEAEIRETIPRNEGELAAQLKLLADHARGLVEYQRVIDRQLKREALELDICRRFMEIPGVGPLCALTFYASIGDPHRFARSTDVGSYFGLAPRKHESGLTIKKARISKMGNKSVRSLLVHTAAMHLQYCDRDSVLRDWTLRLEQRRGRAPSRIALARKLAVVMLAMWKNGSPFEPRRCQPGLVAEAQEQVAH